MPETRSYYQIISDSASESFSHGIPYIFRRKEIPVRIAWTILTLVMAGISGWLVNNTIVDFYGFDTVTKTQTIFETPALFPTVSICNQNMFTTQDGFDYVENYTKTNNLDDVDTQLNKSFFMDNDFVKYGFGVNLLDSNYTNTYRKKMGLQIDEMILDCYFNNKDCDSTDFYWYFDPYYG